MSAYVVSDEHIDVLIYYAIAKQASYYFHPRRVEITRENANEIGQILLDENHRSVNYRYNETDKAPEYKYKPAPGSLPANHQPVQILKAISCLDYQCCETDDWATTHAHAVLEGIKDKAISCLPGYDAAAWGIR